MPADSLGSAGLVVIGGGVIGASIACHLAQSGVDVVLLEQSSLGSGSTCKAAGGVRASFSDPLNVLMGARGLETYSRFQELYGQEIDFRRNGYLYCASDATSLDGLIEASEVHRSLGIASHVVTADEAASISPLIDPSNVRGGLWSPDDARATPESVVAGYASAARRAGARIITGTPVLGIERSADEITSVRTAAGALRTSRIVCAAGPWSAEIGDMVGVPLPVRPSRRVMAFTAAMFEQPQPWPLTVTFPSTVYFHPEGQRTAFGWSDPDEPTGFGVGVELERWLERLAPHLEAAAPTLLEQGIAAAWAGLYENTPDHNQILGRAQDVPGFFYATGFSGHGFLMAPATGEIVRDLVLGREPEFDVGPLDVQRFQTTLPAAERHII